MNPVDLEKSFQFISNMRLLCHSAIEFIAKKDDDMAMKNYLLMMEELKKLNLHTKEVNLVIQRGN